MPQFHYRATAPDGASLEDTLEAPSAHQATLRLQERGYTVNSVMPVHAEFAGARGKQLSWSDLELLSLQLLSITERNLPVVPALRALTADMTPGALKAVLDQVRIDLERGVTIEEALRNRGSALPPLFASAVRAGEASGAGLPGVLKILVQHAARMVSLQNSLHSALAYPLLVVMLTCLVLLLLIWRVIPTYADISPELSNAMRGGSGFSVLGSILHLLVGHPMFLSAMVTVFAVVALLGTRALMRTHANTLRADRLKLRVPRFGHVYYLITIARFSRTLSALLAARVPIVEALELAAAASGSPMLQQAVGEAAPRVALGNTLSDALLASSYFGGSYCWMLDTAERRNAAEEALENLAASAEREAAVDDQVNLQLIGPLALVGAGGLILIIALQFILPINAAFQSLNF